MLISSAKIAGNKPVKLPTLPPVDAEFLRACWEKLRTFKLTRGKFHSVEIVKSEDSFGNWMVSISSKELYGESGGHDSFPGVVPFVQLSNLPVMEMYMKNICPDGFTILTVSINTKQTKHGIKSYWVVIINGPCTERRYEFTNLRNLHDSLPNEASFDCGLSSGESSKTLLSDSCSSKSSSFGCARLNDSSSDCSLLDVKNSYKRKEQQLDESGSVKLAKTAGELDSFSSLYSSGSGSCYGLTKSSGRRKDEHDQSGNSLSSKKRKKKKNSKTSSKILNSNGKKMKMFVDDAEQYASTSCAFH